MGQYKLIISDLERRIYEESTFNIATYLIAALAAEPSTLFELEIAFGRFIPGLDFSWFSDQVRTTDESGKHLLIDLPSKMVCASPEFAKIFPRGEVTSSLEKDGSEFPVRFWISEEWGFTDSQTLFSEEVERRRKDFALKTRCDFRETLYGRELSKFLTSRFDGDLISCHKEWLVTERADLQGRTPREILLEHQDRVDFDLYSRELQWSFLGSCPPLIPIDSEAFRYAGFGTHEYVIYYDLVRHMLKNFTADVDEMEEVKAKWLESPDIEGSSRVPAEIIESERKRLPLEATASEMMIDEDCPICQMMLSEFETPTFMHLDSSHFDEDYVFSSYRTKDEWLKNQLEWAEFNQRFEENQKIRGNSS
jgi:hypothetical protein